MKDWIVKYWLETLFGAVVLVLGALYKRLAMKFKKQLSDQKALKNGMLALLRSEIIRCHDKYMQRGWIPIYALESVLALYCSYNTLGGNGTVTKLVEDIKGLRNSEKGESPEREVYDIIRNT